MSIRLKLTLGYAGVVMLTGGLLLGAVWLFLLRYVPERAFIVRSAPNPHGIFPVRPILLDQFAPRAACVMAVLLVFSLAGGWLLAGRMLAPLTRITDATRRATAGSLAHRIQLTGHSDEFRELADAFDAMLARLEAHHAEQQRFTANASHELRTPLAITRALLDVARSDPRHDTSQLVDRLLSVNSRAIELTEALLLLSRADQRAFKSCPVDLSLIAEEATEALFPLAEKHGIIIEISADAAPAVGSETLLLQMTTNLVHNAVVHNLPSGGSVWITTESSSGHVSLVVENTGDALAPDRVSVLAEPFLRDTERVHADHAGVGLGLAIVKSIAHAHDGTLTLTARPGGGLCAEVRLPSAGLQPSESRTARQPSRAGTDSDP